MELDIPPSPPPIEALLAARRAKRQAIAAKYSSVSAQESVTPSAGPSSVVEPPQTASPTPDEFDLAKHDDEEDAQVKVQAQNNGLNQISAADYDPSIDRREDEQRRVRDEPVKDRAVVIDEEEEEEVDDMFAFVTTEKKLKKVKEKDTTVGYNSLVANCIQRVSSLIGGSRGSRINHHHSRFRCRFRGLLYRHPWRAA